MIACFDSVLKAADVKLQKQIEQEAAEEEEKKAEEELQARAKEAEYMMKLARFIAEAMGSSVPTEFKKKMEEAIKTNAKLAGAKAVKGMKKAMKGMKKAIKGKQTKPAKKAIKGKQTKAAMKAMKA